MAGIEPATPRFWSSTGRISLHGIASRLVCHFMGLDTSSRCVPSHGVMPNNTTLEAQKCPRKCPWHCKSKPGISGCRHIHTRVMVCRNAIRLDVSPCGGHGHPSSSQAVQAVDLERHRTRRGVTLEATLAGLQVRILPGSPLAFPPADKSMGWRDVSHRFEIG